jgi:hypothetical protein
MIISIRTHICTSWVLWSPITTRDRTCCRLLGGHRRPSAEAAVVHPLLPLGSHHCPPATATIVHPLRAAGHHLHSSRGFLWRGFTEPPSSAGLGAGGWGARRMRSTMPQTMRTKTRGDPSATTSNGGIGRSLTLAPSASVVKQRLWCWLPLSGAALDPPPTPVFLGSFGSRAAPCQDYGNATRKEHGNGSSRYRQDHVIYLVFSAYLILRKLKLKRQNEGMILLYKILEPEFMHGI